MNNEDMPASLTKREYFAGLAMQANIIHHIKGGYSFSVKEAAKDAIHAADALLEELSK